MLARDPVTMASEDDRLILAGFLKHTTDNVSRFTPEAVAKITQPEDICWVWLHYLHMPVVAYQLTGDTQYLDQFVKAADVLLTRLRRGLDGYLGFRGLPYELFRDPANPTAEVDVDIAEFETVQKICDFVAAVRAEPALEAVYGAPAQRLLELAENHLAGPKWDTRGCYVDLGQQGAVFRMPAECGNQRDRLTNPHNKQSKMCRSYLALYRVTGKDEYFRRAVKLGVRFKRTLKLDGERYLWNYWDPAGDWDRRSDNPQQWKHWIGPEHRGGYHALTIQMAAALYDHGVVFDRADMQRFVNTQMQLAWNGSVEEPVFRTTGGATPKEAGHAVFMAASLAPFVPAIQEYCYGARATQDRLARRDHAWQGGATAIGYFVGKYLSPRTADPGNLALRDRFAATPANAAFLETMAYRVTAE